MRDYTEGMLERTQMRALPLANRVAEHAPVATACCNACRTCVQTNVLTVALGAVAFAVAPIRRRLKRS
jgi:hypothetical protein